MNELLGREPKIARARKIKGESPKTGQCEIPHGERTWQEPERREPERLRARAREPIMARAKRLRVRTKIQKAKGRSPKARAKIRGDEAKGKISRPRGYQCVKHIGL